MFLIEYVVVLQAADIGVGISGEEGLQASLAADYSIAQVYHLFVITIIFSININHFYCL